MRLIVEGFSKGLYDSTVITKMGLARLQPGLSETEVRLGDCPCTDANAMQFYPKYTISKMYGRESMHGTAWKNSAVVRMYQWRTEAGADFAMAFSCVSGATSAAIASISKSTGVLTFTNVTASGTALASWAPSLTGDMIDICSYGGSAVMVYGGANMPAALYTGDSFIAPLLGEAPSGARCVAAWGSYLFLGNLLVGAVRKNSRIQWCENLTPGSWPAYNYIDLDAEDGDEITAMWLLRDYLVVFKRYKTFLIKYVGGVLVFDWERIDSSIGCVGSNALTEIDGILYFISPDGFYAFDGTKPPYEIDDSIKNLSYNANADIDKTFEVTYYDNSQIFFAVADGSGIYKNRMYIYDSDQGSWTKQDISASSMGAIQYGTSERYIDFPLTYAEYSMTIGSARGTKDPIFSMGSYDGFIYKYGNSANDLGVALNAYWVSPWIDFGFPDRNKRILRVYLYTDPTSVPITGTFTGYTNWDNYTEQVSKTFVTTAYMKTIAEKRLDFTIPCRSFKFKINVNQLNASMTIHKIIIDFLVKGRTITTVDS